MSFGMVQPNYHANYGHYAKHSSKTAKSGDELVKAFYGNVSSAAEKATTKSTGKVLGMTTLKFGDTNQFYGMAASYSEASTPENPIVQVSCNYGGETVKYDIKVNEVNPRNASQLEMFALLSYQDDQGITDRGTFGSYTKMKIYAMNAEHNGYCDGVSDSASFMGEGKDWIHILQMIMKDYFGNPACYAQGLDCQRIIAGLEKWCGKDHAIQNAGETQKVEEPQKTQEAPKATVTYTQVSSRNSWPDPDTKQTEYSGFNGTTVYTSEGIFYLQSSYDTKGQEYSDTVKWTVKFDGDEDYNRAMDFLKNFSAGDSMDFAASEYFWKDFLGGKIDEKEFMEYYGTLDHGKQNFLKKDENGNVYVDREKVSSKYSNYFGHMIFQPLTYADVKKKFEETVRAELKGEKYWQPQNGMFLKEALQNLFSDVKERSYGFAGENSTYTLYEWISELTGRTRGGLMEELTGRKIGTGSAAGKMEKNGGSSTAGKTTSTGKGKNIGVTTIGNQGYIASYADSSTPEDPIIKVGDHEIRVKDVDPRNATEIEMFALNSYLDDIGASNNRGMSSFSKMRNYAKQAEYNGFCEGIANGITAWSRQRDWMKIVGNARQTYALSTIPEIFAQAGACDNFLAAMMSWIAKI